jgi:Flp pilus assembly protein protease CpaA
VLTSVQVTTLALAAVAAVCDLRTRRIPGAWSLT